MRLGLWGARADDSGLGQQTFEFYRNMKPDKTVVVDISVLEKTPDRVMRQYPDRYESGEVKFIYGIPGDGDMREFLNGLDVVFIAESSYNMDFYRIAKELNVKVANQYNYEFFDWLIYRQFTRPDMFIAPSRWHWSDVQTFCDENEIAHVYLHCPVDRTKIKRRHVDSAVTFIHVAGRPAAHDRNGTFQFLEAIKLSDGQLRGLVYTQDKPLADEIRRDFPMVHIKENVKDYTDIYKKGSVLVLPRKYGGNCLPMNEALAAGMPVIMSKLSPQTEFLPDKWLVNTELTNIEFEPRVKIDVYEVKPVELMIKMRWFSSLSHDDMLLESDKADELAESISWDVMKPRYYEALEGLCITSTTR